RKDRECGHKTEFEQRAEPQASQAEADEQGEDVQPHRLTGTLPSESRDNSAEERLCHVVSKRQDEGDKGYDSGRRVQRQRRGGTAPEQKPDRNQARPAPAVGQATDDGTEEEARNAIAEQRESDCCRAEPMLPFKIESQPGEDAGVKHRVEE